ncbi:Bug family tripartite tricarboxylate transporter substrate binding protein [Parapusillimonas granuli]|uniref:Tripartite tricarboxylate transporter substrate binding protein n=1 Tax=Parapusillimonas granuli TaxID=380911 RepID=A0A853G2E2_9BURK|nr:tripartite tricarboxylate transporter substrate binding protein [Parapusillimonas granuli]MBB5214420.1 tripartite-type tricarboxylate transporter receptor subunit TctC [Parapusillimonas granuli]NYT49170.1 tripartite tricarboxylate transporter substrate binding protein [Parapusillimonas granuli]
MIKTPLTFFARCFAVAGLSLAAALPTSAQENWPRQTVKLVVPYAAGGTTDLIARRLAERLNTELGQTVVVENKPGASTNIGAQSVVNAKDGHTILLGSIFQLLNHTFGPKPDFNMFEALEPVSLVANMPFVLGANPGTPFNNGKELVAAAKAEPRHLSVAHAQLDVSLTLLNDKAGMELLLVPYKGGAPSISAAMAGQVDMAYSLVPVMLPQLQAGNLKPLAVSSAKRFESLPDVPTFAESGVDFIMEMWYGLFMPAGTPQTIIDKLAETTQKIMASEQMITSIRAAGADPVHNTPAEFRAQLEKEQTTWDEVARSMPNLVQR